MRRWMQTFAWNCTQVGTQVVIALLSALNTGITYGAGAHKLSLLFAWTCGASTCLAAVLYAQERAS